MNRQTRLCIPRNGLLVCAAVLMPSATALAAPLPTGPSQSETFVVSGSAFWGHVDVPEIRIVPKNTGVPVLPRVPGTRDAPLDTGSGGPSSGFNNDFTVTGGQPLDSLGGADPTTSLGDLLGTTPLTTGEEALESVSAAGSVGVSGSVPIGAVSGAIPTPGTGVLLVSALALSTGRRHRRPAPAMGRR